MPSLQDPRFRGESAYNNKPDKNPMTDQTETPTPPPKKPSIKSAFSPGKAHEKPALFNPDEMDIYCNKVTKETFIFHLQEIDYEALDHAEYNHKNYSVTVFMKDGTSIDLGVKIQWLIRPYFSKAEELQIVQTKDGEAINGTFIPLSHKGKK